MSRKLIIEKQVVENLLEKADSERILFETDCQLLAYNEGKIAGICEILDIAEERDEV